MADGLRVLVVEDCADTAESCCLLLGQWGHHAVAVRDGGCALSAALAFQPDAVLLDIGLPGLTGYQVAARLRGAGLAGVGLVAVTGHGRECDRRASAAAGIDHHLLEPADPAEIERLPGSIRAPRRAAGEGKASEGSGCRQCRRHVGTGNHPGRPPHAGYTARRRQSQRVYRRAASGRSPRRANLTGGWP